MALFSSKTDTGTWRRWVYDQIQTLLGAAGVDLGTKTAEDGSLSSRIVVDPTNPDHDWYFSRGVQWVSPNWELGVTGDSATGIFFNGDSTGNGKAVVAADNHDSRAAGDTIDDPVDMAAVLELSGLSGICRLRTNGTTRLSVSDTETAIDNLRISTNGYLQTAASVAANSGLRVPHGTPPTSPVNGDMWTTTAGLYIQVNGTTVGPLTAGGGGAWELISDTPVTAVANIDLIWDETAYDEIKFVLEGITTGTDNVDIEAQFGHTNGGTIITATNYTTVYNAALSTWTSFGSADHWLLTGAGNLGNAAGEEFNAVMTVNNFAGSNAALTVEGRSNYVNTVGAILDTKFFGSYRAAGHAADTIRFQPSTGNFAATGNIRMYGLKNA